MCKKPNLHCNQVHVALVKPFLSPLSPYQSCVFFCLRLPCSFNTYVILGAYIIQSEAGDWDPETHEGIDYLFNVPFAPREFQTPEMLVRIMEMHQKLK